MIARNEESRTRQEESRTRQEESYKEGLRSIIRGIWIIGKLLPRTFVRQTIGICRDHPIYVALTVIVMAFQLWTIAQERVCRDAQCKRIYLLQHQIDSLTNKQVVYYGYR